jgi:hypothetical protein
MTVNESTLRWVPVEGATLAEMKENGRRSDLYLLGDMKLIWANEGDLWPVRTDTDLRAATAEGAEAMREACAKWHDEQASEFDRRATYFRSSAGVRSHCAGVVGAQTAERDYARLAAMHTAAANASRALPIPGTDALAAKIAEAVEREREAIAQWFDDRAAMMEQEARENDGFGKSTAMLCRSYSEAIRARATEAPE